MKYQQFKDQPLNTKTAEEFAFVRLGLNPDEWCAYAWNHCMDKNGVDEVIQKVEDQLEEDEISSFFLSDLYEELHGSDILPPDQMYVKIVKAPNLKVARELWDDETEVEEKVLLIDWELVQELCK